MTEYDHRQMATDLLDLLWKMDQILKDYSRYLAAHDDGHRLETEDGEDQF